MGEVQAFGRAGPYRVCARGLCAVSNERQRGDDACRGQEEHVSAHIVRTFRRLATSVFNAACSSERTIDWSLNRIYNVNGRRGTGGRLTKHFYTRRPQREIAASKHAFCEIVEGRSVFANLYQLFYQTFFLRVGVEFKEHASSWRRHARSRARFLKTPNSRRHKTRLMHDQLLCPAGLRLPARRSDGAGISTTAGSTDNHSMAQASTVPKRRRRARGGAGVEGVASRGHGREPLGAPTH